MLVGKAAEGVVAELGDQRRHPRIDDGAARLLLGKQAHLAEEVAAVEIGQHDLAAFLVLEHDADRAFEDQVQRVGHLAGPHDRMLRRDAALVRTRDEILDRWM